MTTLADKSLLSVRRHTKTTMLENIVLILGKSRMELSYVDSSLMEEMILLLRTSSNPRQKSHHYDGKVTVQPVHGRQTTYAAGTTRKYTPGASGSNTGKQRMETVTTPKGRVIFPSSVPQTPIFTATTMTTTTPLSPPPQQQSTTESELVERVAALEKKLSDLEQTNKNLDNTTRNLGSRVYNLDLRDLPHKINEVVHKNVKEAVQIALQAPFRDRFRDLPEEDMKEKRLKPRKFESGTYRIHYLLPEHIALYEALEASMARAQRDEFLTKKDKSRKRCHDDQDPPPPPPDSDLSKRRRHDTSSSGSSQPLAPQSSAWKNRFQRATDQPLQKPAWVIPTSYIPDAKNNRANALATTYQAPTENSLLEKIGYMRTFMNWYCQKMGKTELTQADLKGQAYEVVKAFYPDVVHLQFQMEECHKMLTDQIDWTNPEGDQVRIDINRPLPLSGPPRHVTVQTQFFFNHDLDYLRYGSYMRILSVDFKNLYPSDFEDLNLLLLQGHLNYLPGSDIRMLSIALNLTKPGWDATGFEFKHDYTIIDSPSAVVFLVSNNERKIMRFNELYKFSDGTLTNIMEALDYRVKEYKVNRLNPGMNTWFWTDKGSGQALSISKIKAARYHDFGHELLVPEHMWIDDVCTYDISASYGISHWWFNRQKFYIDRHTTESSHKVVRTHMRILSVVRIKAYSRYGYDYLKEITLRIADHQEYTIAEKDFKNLYPSDVEDLNLLLLQGHLNHLPGSDIRMLSTKQLNLTKPRWDATGFEFKHDYTIIDLPRAVVFPVSNNERKIMRFNKIYKFSDGTLTNIMEALDYRVKEYKAIKWRLKTRRIYWNLECFVGGRVRDIDYRLLQRTE
ncbi:hypothetical protein Tco_0886660 [Tanacetum coccineum]